MKRSVKWARTVALSGALSLIISACSREDGSAVSFPSSEARSAVAHGDSPSGADPALSFPKASVFAAMLEAIQAASPPGWRFSLKSDRLDGSWRLDGDVNDGSGPGSLFVDVTLRPGMLVAHPCADPEFRQGGRCLERALPEGDLLALRDVVVDRGGMRTIQVILVHPDGSGVGAEAGNWTIGALASGAPKSVGGLPSPQVTRADPLYTVDQLARLVQAVDERT